jgi:hypothetical protein
MKTKMEQFPATNPNSVLSVAVDGTVLYSNEADELLLKKWSTKIGEKLPSSIVDLLQKAISWNSHAQMEVKVGNRVYLDSFHPLLEDEGINVYVFDISDQKVIESKFSFIGEINRDEGSRGRRT